MNLMHKINLNATPTNKKETSAQKLKNIEPLFNGLTEILRNLTKP